MISNPERISTEALPFEEYINNCRAIIRERRLDLDQNPKANLIIDANCPYEFYPAKPVMAGNGLKYGVLLVHGLLDCPFSLKDLAANLQANGILCRSVLLPGHGTKPEDLLSVSWQDWVKTVRYGIESLSKQVDRLYLAGFSTGAALSLHQAFQGQQFAGIILIAPAIRIKVPVKIIVAWRYVKKWLHINHNQWIDRLPEIDYTKYLSIPFNAVNQVSALTEELIKLRMQHKITCPIFMVLSEEDETISSRNAIDFFSGYDNQNSKLLLYSAIPSRYKDSRIINRTGVYTDLNIRHFSHISLPYAPDNPHYGQQGDCPYASLINKYTYGAYNRAEASLFWRLSELKLIDNYYRPLTYNPDFKFMAEEIRKFVMG